MTGNLAPLVSVVMPVFNGERFLAEAIESILAQTFTDFELLIVDDGSQDNSAEIIRAYEERDDRIRFFQLERNVGMASARNHALDASKGEYIAAMDCDDVSMPVRLQRQVEFLQSNPEVGALGTCFRRVKHDLSLLNDFKAPLGHSRIVLNMFIGGGFVLHSSLVVRRKFLTVVGGYEPGRRHADDLELHSRMLPETGIRYANLRDILVLYLRHDRANSFDRDAEQHLQAWESRSRMLERLWHEAPDTTIDRFFRLHMGMKFGWVERRRARQDLCRLIHALIANKWVDPADESLLVAEMNRRLESTTPRRWQMFLHWRRHHFGR